VIRACEAGFYILGTVGAVVASSMYPSAASWIDICWMGILTGVAVSYALRRS